MPFGSLRSVGDSLQFCLDLHLKISGATSGYLLTPFPKTIAAATSATDVFFWIYV